MTGWLDRLVDRLTGRGLPAGFPGRLAGEERVLAWARAGENDQLVATSLGLWMPDGAGSRRVGWHLISKATWGGGTLVVTEAAEIGTVEDAVLLADRPARRFRLGRSVGLPEAVHARVTGSIKSSHHRDLPGGGAWFVQRRVTGQDGVVLQVRVDPGTDEQAVRSVAAQVAEQLRRVRGIR